MTVPGAVPPPPRRPRGEPPRDHSPTSLQSCRATDRPPPPLGQRGHSVLRPNRSSCAACRVGERSVTYHVSVGYAALTHPTWTIESGRQGTGVGRWGQKKPSGAHPEG